MNLLELDDDGNPIDGILFPLIRDNKLWKVQNQDGNAIVKIPGTDTWIDGIETFDPGEAYYLRANGEIDLTINEGDITSPRPKPDIVYGPEGRPRIKLYGGTENVGQY